ncbi:MAG: hypothetical protein ACI8UZ_000840, partial [Akkermansiaceae bacterium]
NHSTDRREASLENRNALNHRTAWKKDFNAVTRGFAISAGRYT